MGCATCGGRRKLRKGLLPGMKVAPPPAQKVEQVAEPLQKEPVPILVSEAEVSATPQTLEKEDNANNLSRS